MSDSDSGEEQAVDLAALEGEASSDLRAGLVLEQTNHCLAEAGARARDGGRRLVVRGGDDHRARALGRVLALEDARADEDTWG